MWKPIKFVLALLCLQVVGFAGLNATKEAPLDYFDLKAGFEELQRHLNDKVNSDQLEENLNAARELVGCEAKTGCISSLLRHKPVESNLQKVARLFVRLLEMANQPEEKCDQQTLDYLGDLAQAHSLDWPKIKLEPGQSRGHFRVYGRVDEILDAHFDAILSKCEPVFDEFYLQLNMKLDPKLKQQVYEIYPDEVMEMLPKIWYDRRIIASRWAKLKDFKNYKKALQTDISDKFQDYFLKFYRTYLTKPCKAYYEHFESITEPVAKLRKFCIKFQIPMKLSKGFEQALARHEECYYAGKLIEEGTIRVMAHEILQDYKLDVRFAKVDWRSDRDRENLGRRIY